jgi:hypothetical protein
MRSFLGIRVIQVAVLLMSLGCASALHAEDFFSALFGAITGQRPTPAGPPLMPDMTAPPSQQPVPQRSASSGGQAYCVRACDGRYFPISGPDNHSRIAACNSFCPASETSVFYGSNIAHAMTANGKPYASLTNAFRYRTEIVPGCTCNGKDEFGLAKIDIQDDPTLRKGDIVVGGDEGLRLAQGGAARTHHR